MKGSCVDWEVLAVGMALVDFWLLVALAVQRLT